MPDLVQLSFRALDYATRPARFAVGTLVRFVREDEPESEAPPHDHPQTAAEPPPEPERPSEKAARRAVRHEPTKGQAAAIRQQQRAEEWGEPAPKP